VQGLPGIQTVLWQELRMGDFPDAAGRHRTGGLHISLLQRSRSVACCAIRTTGQPVEALGKNRLQNSGLHVGRSLANRRRFLSYVLSSRWCSSFHWLLLRLDEHRPGRHRLAARRLGNYAADVFQGSGSFATSCRASQS
jgi:hypothetical protein